MMRLSRMQIFILGCWMPFAEVALSQLPVLMKTRPEKWVVDTGPNLDRY